jgi:hypothetical protein
MIKNSTFLLAFAFFSFLLLLSACTEEESEETLKSKFLEKIKSQQKTSEETPEKTTPASSGTNSHANEAFPPIYVSIFSHNEEAYSSGYPNFVDDEDAFWEQREGVVNFATMLAEEGVMYNYQSDWTFLLAMSIYDEGTASTNNKNLVRYLKEDLGFEVDPHAHETEYNYADVAYLIEQLGVEPSQTVGGALLLPPKDSKLEYLWEPLTGWKYPSYTWKAKVIMGGGTAKHQNEEALWISGIWKPQNDENTLVHDDDAPLPVIGTYGRRSSDGDSLGTHIDELLELQKEGVLIPGKMYTASLSLRQDEFTEEYIEDFKEMIEGYEEETAEGKIIWVGFDELYNIWITEYNAEPNQLHYLDFHSDEATTSTTEGTCGNGTCELFERKMDICPEDCE